MAKVEIGSLVDAAKALGPFIREHADEAERNRRLSPAVSKALTDAGFQRMLLPRALGGLEVDPPTCARVVEEVASADSAAGWSLQAGNSGAWWAARLPGEGAEEMFGGSPNRIVAAAFHPPQQATPVPGGYRINGRGPLASNIHEAVWLFVTALVMDGDQPRLVDGQAQVIVAFLAAADVEIVDTWDTLGMRGTDSQDVVMKDVFVPETRTFPLVPDFTPGPAYQGPLYRYPGIGQVQVILPPVLLAIARGSIDELKRLAERKTSLGSMKTLKDRQTAQQELAKAEAELRAARALLYESIEGGWARTVAGAPHTLEQKADLLLAGVHAAATSARVADRIHRLAGTSGIYKRSRLERLFRDAQTLRHHGFMAENKYETAGQVYLGVAPEFGFVAF